MVWPRVVRSGNVPGLIPTPVGAFGAKDHAAVVKALVKAIVWTHLIDVHTLRLVWFDTQWRYARTAYERARRAHEVLMKGQAIPVFGKFFTPDETRSTPSIQSRVYSRGEIPAILKLDASEGGNRKDECWWRRIEYTERLDPHQIRGLLVTAPRGEKGLVYGKHEELITPSSAERGATCFVLREAQTRVKRRKSGGERVKVKCISTWCLHLRSTVTGDASAAENWHEVNRSWNPTQDKQMQEIPGDHDVCMEFGIVTTTNKVDPGVHTAHETRPFFGLLSCVAGGGSAIAYSMGPGTPRSRSNKEYNDLDNDTQCEVLGEKYGDDCVSVLVGRGRERGNIQVAVAKS
ncbi:hypothetical protein EDB86DRAFT_3248414 [Lactarius hatsudake]|nr:hypothetical protein EDB86DRAFT_3248414 [Lactarius hatsudake]